MNSLPSQYYAITPIPCLSFISTSTFGSISQFQPAAVPHSFYDSALAIYSRHICLYIILPSRCISPRPIRTSGLLTGLKGKLGSGRSAVGEGISYLGITYLEYI
jgi:hypothetical protein